MYVHVVLDYVETKIEAVFSTRKAAEYYLKNKPMGLVIIKKFVINMKFSRIKNGKRIPQTKKTKCQ